MKRIFQFVGFLAVIAFTAWILPLGGASQAALGPHKVAEDYAGAVKSREWSQAYSLTSNSFRQVIPEEAFTLYSESNAGGSSAYEIVDTKVLSETRARVEIRTPGAQEVGFVEVSLEAGEWRVEPNWRLFYSTKLDLLPPVLSFSENDMSVSLKYVLESRGKAEEAPYTLVRLDIRNIGTSDVRWELPASGSGDGYLLDSATHTRLQRSFGYGIVADADQDFHFIPKPGPGTMLFGPEAAATLLVHIDGLLPRGIDRVDLFLAGLTSVADGHSWSIRIDGLSFRPEVVPS